MTKAEAAAAVKALVRTLGRGWVPKVWENLGWHAKASTRDNLVHLYIEPNKKGVPYYVCMMGEGGAANAAFMRTKCCKDPVKALTFSAKHYCRLLQEFTLEHQAIARSATLARLAIKAKPKI